MEQARDSLSELSLVPLPERPELLETVLTWNLQVWGERIPGYDAEGWRAFYDRALVPNYARYESTSELVWVVLDADGRLVGSIALVYEDDLAEFEDLGPWMAAFVVDPEVRHQGIGARIVKLFETHVAHLGVAKLYLWTDHYARWYEKLGYRHVASGTLVDIAYEVMEKEL